MSVVVAPLTATVTVTKTSTYTPSANGHLLECVVTLSADGRASTFDMTLDNRTAAYTSIYPGVGAEVVVSVGKSGYSMETLFNGVVERRRVSRPTKNEHYMHLGGTDNSFQLLNTIVPGSRNDTGLYQLEPGNVNRQSGWFIRDIVFDLMSKHAPGITATSATVAPSSTYISPLIFNYKPLMDCVKELADLAPLYNFYVDGNKTLQFFYERTKDSGIVIDNTLIKNIVIETDLQNTKNVIYAFGGDEPKRDVQYEGVSATVSTFSAWHAVQFTPAFATLSEVWLHVSRTGEPPADLEGIVVMDYNNQPLGSKLAVFSVPLSKVDTTADWRVVTVNYEPVQVGKPHWVILYHSGGSASNTYKWSNDGGTSGVSAVSADGTNWSVYGSSYRSAIRTVYRVPMRTIERDTESIKKYGSLETTISQPNIYDRNQLVAYTTRYKTQYGKARTELKASIYPPDRLPPPGQLITISDSVSGASGLYTTTQVEYVIRGYETHDIQLTAFRFE